MVINHYYFLAQLRPQKFARAAGEGSLPNKVLKITLFLVSSVLVVWMPSSLQKRCKQISELESFGGWCFGRHFITLDFSFSLLKGISTSARTPLALYAIFKSTSELGLLAFGRQDTW